MRDAGLRLVRIGEFAWSWYEPARDVFDWRGLDTAVQVIADAGLHVVLGTPTATPPRWLTAQRPTMLSVGPDGRRRAAGSRRHVCLTSPATREESERIVAALVGRYGRHDSLVAWQLDNEPGNHDSARCWCDACAAAFRSWLLGEYGGVAALDEAWGTTFWSGRYGIAELITLPVPTVTAQSPSLELAHRRFAAAQTTAFLAAQREQVHAGSPGRDTFTNLYLGDVDVDAAAVGRLHGLGAIDSYPHGVAGPHDVGFLLDLARGTALPTGSRPAHAPGGPGGRAWVVEQQPGPVNWTPTNPAVPAGQVRLWGWQAALHGIEALLFFRWRAARSGQEQYHSGLLRQDGSPDRGLAEATQLAGELARVSPALLARPAARVALLMRYDDAWALDISPHLPGASHRALVTAAYTAARRLGLDVDVVPVDCDLTGYSFVLAPGLHLAGPQVLTGLQAALTAGATVLVGCRALVKDEANVWVDEALPAGLADRLGARVVSAGSPQGWPHGWPDGWPDGRPDGGPDGEPARPGGRSQVDVGGTLVDPGVWLETLEPLASDVDVLARAVGGPADGAAVVVTRDRLVHVGAASSAVWLAVLARLTGLEPLPAHLEQFTRAGRPVTIDHAALQVHGLDLDAPDASDTPDTSAQRP
jgi:beta-galactosidase